MKTLLKLAAAGALGYAAVKLVKKYDLVTKATEVASTVAAKLVAAWPFEAAKDDEDTEDDAELEKDFAGWQAVADQGMQSHSSAWEGTNR